MYNNSDRGDRPQRSDSSAPKRQSFEEFSYNGRQERSSSRNYSSSGPRREYGGGYRNASRGGSGRGGSGRGRQTMQIDLSLFVKKANPEKLTEYTPNNSFKGHGLHMSILQNLTKRGYENPTPIQDKAIPVIMDSHDILGIANTGTGKTAAFLLPLIHHVYSNSKKSILILAPTRELATQIQQELRSYTQQSNIFSTLVIGGESMYKQIKSLQRPNQFIIATPGRAVDLISKKAINIAEVDTIVLDEMDQMLDMGFVDEIKDVIKASNPDRHLLMFSATITDQIRKIAMDILHSPVEISVVKGKTTDNVEQDVVEVQPGEQKFDKLVELLDGEDINKAIIFDNTKMEVANIENQLRDAGFRVGAIHGDKNLQQRKRALESFKAGKIDILVATNVASRGLDIPLVSHVINYSLPQSREDYIHRIGRTGRAGNVGKAFTFITHKRSRGY